MENPNEKDDLNQYKRINTELFEQSVEIKKRNKMVQEKLRTLKKLSDEMLKTMSTKKHDSE